MGYLQQLVGCSLCALGGDYLRCGRSYEGRCLCFICFGRGWQERWWCGGSARSKPPRVCASLAWVDGLIALACGGRFRTPHPICWWSPGLLIFANRCHLGLVPLLLLIMCAMRRAQCQYELTHGHVTSSTRPRTIFHRGPRDLALESAFTVFCPLNHRCRRKIMVLYSVQDIDMGPTDSIKQGISHLTAFDWQNHLQHSEHKSVHILPTTYC